MIQEGGARVGNFDRELGKEVADLSEGLTLIIETCNSVARNHGYSESDN